MKRYIPLSLIYLRLLLGPVMIALSISFGKSYSFIIFCLLLTGLLSDIFDGIIARKLKVSTEKLRLADSRVDVVFWICTGIVAYLLWPVVIMANIVPIVLLFALEGICYAVSKIKFKKPPCVHAYLAKFWGIILFLSLSSLILFGFMGWLFTVCSIVGLIMYTENVLITLILKEWTHDIPSLLHALKIRKGKSFKKYKLFHG